MCTGAGYNVPATALEYTSFQKDRSDNEPGCSTGPTVYNGSRSAEAVMMATLHMGEMDVRERAQMIREIDNVMVKHDLDEATRDEFWGTLMLGIEIREQA